jgi:hypothetical protein
MRRRNARSLPSCGFKSSRAEKDADMPSEETHHGGKAGDDPLDAFRDDTADVEEDTEGQEALGEPENLKPGQRRIVEDDSADE